MIIYDYHRFLAILRKNHDARHLFSGFLDYHEIPHRITLKKCLGHSVEVGRFNIRVSYHPASFSYFDRVIENYIGPHIPFLVSYRDYCITDEWYGEHGQKPRIISGQFYGIVPQFVLEEPWPSQRLWRWTPAARITESILLDLLRREHEEGGWRKNHRGRFLIPKRTGVSNVQRIITSTGNWASKRSGGERGCAVAGERDRSRNIDDQLSILRSDDSTGATDHRRQRSSQRPARFQDSMF